MKKVQDYYFHQAKKQNFSARSVFKLKEIDQKFRLIRPNFEILDLGASPGSWTEYSIRKDNSIRITAIDLNPLKATLNELEKKQVSFIQKSIVQMTFLDFQKTFDLIMSDLSPQTSGHKELDHSKSLELCREAMKLVSFLLKKKKNFLCKVFDGEDFKEFLTGEVKPYFKKYRLYKPKSCRKESRELFVLGFGYQKASKK